MPALLSALAPPSGFPLEPRRYHGNRRISYTCRLFDEGESLCRCVVLDVSRYAYASICPPGPTTSICKQTHDLERLYACIRSSSPGAGFTWMYTSERRLEEERRHSRRLLWNSKGGSGRFVLTSCNKCHLSLARPRWRAVAPGFLDTRPDPTFLSAFTILTNFTLLFSGRR